MGQTPNLQQNVHPRTTQMYHSMQAQGMSSPLTLPFKYEQQGVQMVAQRKYGMVRSLAFTLPQAAWVSAEVHSNFLLSNVGLILKRSSVSAGGKTDVSEIMARGELGFVNERGHAVTVRRWLGALLLEQGTYVLVVHDDNWVPSFGAKLSAPVAVDGGSRCVPLSFKFVAVPVANRPAIVAVHPAPSFPLPLSTQIVVRVRFSEPIEATKADMKRVVTLGGVGPEAVGGVSEEDGGRVWVLTFPGGVGGQGVAGGGRELRPGVSVPLARDRRPALPPRRPRHRPADPPRPAVRQRRAAAAELNEPWIGRSPRP